MLKINANPTFDAIVKVATTALSGDFGVKFKAYKLSELDKLTTAAREKGDVIAGVLEQVVVGFTGVESDAGPVAFSPDTLRALCDQPGVAEAMLVTFYASHREETSKN